MNIIWCHYANGLLLKIINRTNDMCWRKELGEKLWVLDGNWTGAGGLPYKSDRDAYQKIKITPLRETNMGVAQA